MTWLADKLGEKTNSHYLQYDNLVDDVRNGKQFDGSSGTHYAWVLHTGTYSYVRSSQNDIILCPESTGSGVRITANVNTQAFLGIYSTITGTLMTLRVTANGAGAYSWTFTP